MDGLPDAVTSEKECVCSISPADAFSSNVFSKVLEVRH